MADQMALFPVPWNPRWRQPSDDGFCQITLALVRLGAKSTKTELYLQRTVFSWHFTLFQHVWDTFVPNNCFRHLDGELLGFVRCVGLGYQ